MENHHTATGDGESLLLDVCGYYDLKSCCRYPEQRLTRAQALKGMTLDAAYASFAEHELGSLTVGKKGERLRYISFLSSLIISALTIH